MPETRAKKKPLATGGSTNGTKPSGATIDVTALRAALAKASGLPRVSRPALARLVGAHVNTVALWERGNPVGPKYLARVRALQAKVAKGERVDLAAKGKGATSKKETPPKARTAKKTKRAARKRKIAAPSKKATETYDVKALRSKIGASQVAFAKLVGAAINSIKNWESGKPITPKNLARVRDLAKRVAAGEVKLAAPKKAVAAPKKATAPRRRAVSVVMEGSGPLVYATVATLVKHGGETLVRFGVRVPGGGVRVVTDVVVPDAVLETLTR